MSMPFNPDMLTLARESRGLSQTDLAGAIGRTPGYVNKAERGFIQPNDVQIAAFGKALRYPTPFVTSQERVMGYDSPCLYHRKRKTLQVRVLAQVAARMRFDCTFDGSCVIWR